MYSSFSEESLAAVEEMLDFARCERVDGSFYGTGGTCRKGVPAPNLPKKGIKGRVPRNNPKEPLASGFTPLEKAKQKLAIFESKITNPDIVPSEKQLEQYGKLKNAVEDYEKRRDGKKNFLGRTDNSDLDKSVTRANAAAARQEGKRMISPLAKELGVNNRYYKATLASAGKNKKINALLTKGEKEIDSEGRKTLLTRLMSLETAYLSGRTPKGAPGVAKELNTLYKKLGIGGTPLLDSRWGDDELLAFGRQVVEGFGGKAIAPSDIVSRMRSDKGKDPWREP